MGSRGLQEERVERDAWQGIVDALTRLKAAKEKEDKEREVGIGGGSSRADEDMMRY